MCINNIIAYNPSDNNLALKKSPLLTDVFEDINLSKQNSEVVNDINEIFYDNFSIFKDQYFENGFFPWFLNNTDDWYAQSFKPTINRLSMVRIRLSRIGALSANLWCFITDSLSLDDYVCFDIIQCYTIPECPDYIWKDIYGGGVHLMPENNYYIIIFLFDDLNDGDFVLWQGGNNGYFRGNMFRSYNGGETWMTLTPYDLEFQIWGNIKPPGDPSSLDAFNPTATSIDLEWIIGAESDKTRIMRGWQLSN